MKKIEVYIVEADYYDYVTGEYRTEEIAAFESRDDANDFIEIYGYYIWIYTRHMYETCYNLSINPILIRSARATKMIKWVQSLKENSLVIQKAFIDIGYYK